MVLPSHIFHVFSTFSSSVYRFYPLSFRTNCVLSNDRAEPLIMLTTCWCGVDMGFTHCWYCANIVLTFVKWCLHIVDTVLALVLPGVDTMSTQYVNMSSFHESQQTSVLVSLFCVRVHTSTRYCCMPYRRRIHHHTTTIITHKIYIYIPDPVVYVYVLPLRYAETVETLLIYCHFVYWQP
jgi:hypothetical protein